MRKLKIMGTRISRSWRRIKGMKWQVGMNIGIVGMGITGFCDDRNENCGGISRLRRMRREKK